MKSQDNLLLQSITGVGAESQINVVSTAGYDGGAYVSEQSPVRYPQLVFTALNSSGLAQIYQTFLTNQVGTLYFITDVSERKILCRTEKVEHIPTDYPQKISVGLVCEQPDFSALVDFVNYIAQIIPLWEFPCELTDEYEWSKTSDNLIAEVHNDGELVTGAVFIMTAIVSTENPKIEDINTHKWIEIDTSLTPNDTIIIDTRNKQKAVVFVNGMAHEDIIEKIISGIRPIKLQGAVNYMNRKVYGSTFLQIDIGRNEYRYTAGNNKDDNNLEISCVFSPKWRAIY